MAAAGSKGKRFKGKTLNVNEFLNSEGKAGPGYAVATAKLDWAAEMENVLGDGDAYDNYVPPSQYVLPTAPRATRGPNVDPDSIPDEGPFIASLYNLHFEITVPEIENFFAAKELTATVNVVTDGDGRMKGFGTATFQTKAELLEALCMSESRCGSRKIRITVADGKDGRGRDRQTRDTPDNTPGDWRSAPKEDRPTPAPSQRSYSRPDDDKLRNGERSRQDFQYGSEYSKDTSRDSYRSNRDHRDTREEGRSDGGTWARREDRPSTGGGGYDRSESRYVGGSGRGGGGYSGERYESREGNSRTDYNSRGDSSKGSYGHGYSSERDRPQRSESYRDYRTSDSYNRPRQTDRDSYRGGSGGAGGGGYSRDQGGREESGYGYDKEESRYRPAPRGDRNERRSSVDYSDPGSSRGVERVAPPPPPEDNQPKERRKLQLAPRSEEAKAAAASAAAGSAIFGGAKPVDTAAREKEIFEKKQEERKREEEERRAQREAVRAAAEEHKVILQKSSNERSRVDTDHSTSSHSVESHATSKQSESTTAAAERGGGGSRQRERDSSPSRKPSLTDAPEESRRREVKSTFVPAEPPKVNVWEIRKTKKEDNEVVQDKPDITQTAPTTPKDEVSNSKTDTTTVRRRSTSVDSAGSQRDENSNKRQISRKSSIDSQKRKDEPPKRSERGGARGAGDRPRGGYTEHENNRNVPSRGSNQSTGSRRENYQNQDRSSKSSQDNSRGGVGAGRGGGGGAPPARGGVSNNNAGRGGGKGSATVPGNQGKGAKIEGGGAKKEKPAKEQKAEAPKKDTSLVNKFQGLDLEGESD